MKVYIALAREKGEDAIIDVFRNKADAQTCIAHYAAELARDRGHLSGDQNCWKVRFRSNRMFLVSEREVRE